MKEVVATECVGNGSMIIAKNGNKVENSKLLRLILFDFKKAK